MSFQESAKLRIEQLSNQELISLKEALEQLKWQSANSIMKNKKRKLKDKIKSKLKKLLQFYLAMH